MSHVKTAPESMPGSGACQFVTINGQQDLRAESEPYLVNGHRYGGRWNSVRHDFKGAWSKSDAGRHVEPSGDGLCSRNDAHCAEVMGASIDYMSGSAVGDSYQGPVRGALVVIPVHGALGKAVELRSTDQVVGDSVGEGTGNAGYDRLPSRVVGPAGSVYLNGR